MARNLADAPGPDREPAPSRAEIKVDIETEPQSLNPLIPQSLLHIPPEDPRVYDLICQADTVGVFQIESRAQMSMLPRLRPRCFYDLVIEVAIVRPGPIQGGMVHPYLRRRDGIEPVTFPSDAVRDVLAKTLGVPLFQEQVMRLAVVAAGFTPGEADQLRRSMAAWKRGGQIDKFQRKLIEGMLANGYTRQFAEQIFNQIRGFGEYGFPESHAASFALLVYASAWLKCYYPAAFYAAMLNSQPLGFYTPGQLIRDAIAHGVEVRPVDVCYSEWDCTLEGKGIQGLRDLGIKENADPDPQSLNPLIPQSLPPALRLGMRLVRGLKREGIEGLRDLGIKENADPDPQSLNPLIPQSLLLRLAAADAFRSLGLSRRQALWRILSLDDRDPRSRQPGLFDDLPLDEPPAALPPMSLEETMYEDYESQGFSLNAHPMQLIRRELAALRVIPNGKLSAARAWQRIRVAGLVTCRQRPGTAKGTVFITLEDETGMANLIVRPQVWERDWRIARNRAALVAEGRIERQANVVHVMVTRFSDLPTAIHDVRVDSRDFH
ncbi:MAG: error-prone DNA polymerase [Phycisphaerae bacterium]